MTVLIQTFNGRKYVEVAEFRRIAGELSAENERLKAEIERHASLDYWHERGRAAEAERDRLKVLVKSHRSKLQQILDEGIDTSTSGGLAFVRAILEEKND